MALALGLFTVLIAAASSADQVPRTYSTYGPFRYAMVHALAGVNLEDAKVAVKLHWSRHLDHTFPGMESEFEIRNDANALVEMVADGKLHGLSLGIAQYLGLRRRAELKPVFISSRLSSPLESHLFLVRRGRGWKTMGDLPVRSLAMEKASTPNIGQMWLETLLNQRNLPTVRNYFTHITTAAKPARIILPVFFGKADACLVPESAYHTMAELNPQIGRRLEILARSPGLIKTIHCATDMMPDHMVERFVKKGVSMEDTIDGRQLLLIFHVKKNFVYQSQYVTDSERIFREYEKLLPLPPH